MTGAKKIWTKQCTIKKNPYKNDCCQKQIGTNQLQKMATYKNDCPKKSEPNSIGKKKCAL